MSHPESVPSGATQPVVAPVPLAPPPPVMVYTSLPGLPLTRLEDLVDRLPTVAAGMVGGRWTAAAEKALLEIGR